MKKKKLISLLLTCSLLVTVAAGCSSKNDTPPADPAKETETEAEASKPAEAAGDDSASAEAAGGEKVVLNYYAWSEGDYLQEIVDSYNAQSTVAEVKMTQVNSSDYDDKLLTMLSGKNDIDIFNMRSGSLLTNLASTGNLADISQYITDSGLDISIYGTAFADTKVDDKFYSLPYRASAFGLFYNKKLFDEKGITYPDNLTWEEYAALAKELTTGEGTDRVYGGYIPDWSRCPYPVLQGGSNLTDDDLAPITSWMEYLNRLYNTDNSHMSYTDMKSTGTDAINFFCNSGCAMYPGGEWSISDVLTMLKNNPQLAETFELGIAAVPQINKDGEKMTIGGVSTFAGINATSEKKEAAFDFLRYIAGKESAMAIAKSGAIPAYIDGDVTAAFEEVLGVDGAGNMLDLSKVSENLFIPVYTEIVDTYMEELELYLIGDQTLDDAVSNFEQRRAELTN